MEEHGTVSAGDRRAAMTMLPLSPGRNDTFVIQFQKDQIIHRVPPPHNTKIMENQYQNHKDLRQGRCCPNLLCTITLTLLAILVIIGITITILYFIFSPKAPTFSITEFAVKSSNNSHQEYHVSLNVTNPDKRLGVEYQRDDEVFLVFEKRKVAKGMFPGLDQDPRDLNIVILKLKGIDGASLPPHMEKSMKSNNDDIHVALVLGMKLRVKVTASRLESWVMKFNVECMFEVNTLRNDTRVLSQDCRTDFNQS